jgi:hypothetical protein
MGITIKDEGGNVYVIRIMEVLKKAEFDAMQAGAAKVLENDPLMRVKLLMIVENFKGWERNVEWGDISFYSKYGDKIMKIAIAGDPKWETDFKMFTGSGFRAAPVKYFPLHQLEQARIWLAE